MLLLPELMHPKLICMRLCGCGGWDFEAHDIGSCIINRKIVELVIGIEDYGRSLTPVQSTHMYPGHEMLEAIDNRILR